MTFARAILCFGAMLAAALHPVSKAQAGIVLSQLVVELQPGQQTREDIEVWNDSDERAYVAVEPREIVGAGTPGQTTRHDVNPETLGLLVSPARMILEPGQRKLVRVAAVGKPVERERVYRVTVKPVSGEIQSEQSGLKLLVGYDALVLVRPARDDVRVTGSRIGDTLTLRNDGNVSVELIDGQHCDGERRICTPLPGKRLYAGAEWSIGVGAEHTANFMIRSPKRTKLQAF